MTVLNISTRRFLENNIYLGWCKIHILHTFNTTLRKRRPVSLLPKSHTATESTKHEHSVVLGVLWFKWSNTSPYLLITCCLTSGYYIPCYLLQSGSPPRFCFCTLEPLMCKIARCSLNNPRWRVKAPLFVRQECESAAGPGGELRAGPDLHHRENHLRLLPQQCGGAELRCQPAGGRLHAALQTRPQLPGTLPCVHVIDSSRDVAVNSQTKWIMPRSADHQLIPLSPNYTCTNSHTVAWLCNIFIHLFTSQQPAVATTCQAPTTPALTYSSLYFSNCCCYLIMLANLFLTEF